MPCYLHVALATCLNVYLPCYISPTLPSSLLDKEDYDVLGVFLICLMYFCLVTFQLPSSLQEEANDIHLYLPRPASFVKSPVAQ